MQKLLSGARVFPADANNGPWLDITFACDNSITAAFSVNPDDILRAVQDGQTEYYRLAGDVPLYQILEDVFRTEASALGFGDPANAEGDALMQSIAQTQINEGNRAARIERLSPAVYYQLSEDVAYVVWHGTLRVLPVRPVNSKNAVWFEKIYTIPMLINYQSNTVTKLGDEMLPAGIYPYYQFDQDANDIAMDAVLRGEPDFPAVDDLLPAPLFRLILRPKQKATATLVTASGKQYASLPVNRLNQSVMGPMYPSNLMQTPDGLFSYYRWEACRPPANDRQGVAIASADGTLSVTFYEGDLAFIRTETGDRWYQCTLRNEVNNLPAWCHSGIYQYIRSLFDLVECSPFSLTLQTASTDPDTVAKELLSLWGKNMNNLSPGNVLAARSYTVGEIRRNSQDHDGGFSFYSNFTIEPVNKEAQLSYWMQANEKIEALFIPTGDGKLRLLFYLYISPSENGTWTVRYLSYGART